MAAFAEFWRRLATTWGMHEHKLPPHAWSYFDHMASLYLSLGAGNSEADKILEKGKDRDGDLKWGDIFRLERIVLHLQPPNVLQRNVWIVRERFREIAGPTIYKAYIASNPPTETKTLRMYCIGITRCSPTASASGSI